MLNINLSNYKIKAKILVISKRDVSCQFIILCT